MDVFIILFGIPIVLTVFNFWNLFGSKKIFPHFFLITTIAVGLFFYGIFLSLCSSSASVNESVAIGTFHSILNHDYLLSFILPCAIGGAGLFIIAFFPAKKLSPLIAVFGLAGTFLLNIYNILFAIQYSKFVFTQGKLGIDLFPYLFHLNVILLSIYHVRKQINQQLALIEERNLKSKYTWQKKLYQFLSNSVRWHLAGFLVIFPVAILLEIILILFGQGAAGAINVFAMTADWTFSTQVPPPPIEYSGHYLCTVAAGGHKKVVKPLRFGKRRGQKIVVNRQLMVANAFEELIQDRWPKFHKAVRSFYDNHGYPLAKIITTKFRADMIYILMKPAEMIFLFCLYLFCANPEEKISRQYAE